MLFTNPIGLWALAGLSIPVAIHLLSRKEGRVIRMGSVRHLEETNTQQFKGIRLNEIVLLALRSLIIVLFVLLMSGLSFHQAAEADTKWVVIEKGLEKFQEVKTQLDAFQQEGYELHWLQKEFPLLDDSVSISAHMNYRQLIEDLVKENVSEAIVIAQNKVTGFSGMRSSLPPNVRWISVAPKAIEYPLSAVKKSDSTYVRKGYASAEETYFITQGTPAVEWNLESNMPDTLMVTLVTDNSHVRDKKIMTAALRSIEEIFPVVLKLDLKTPDKITSHGKGWCIWIAGQSASSLDYDYLIYSQPGPEKEIAIQEKNNQWKITKALNEEVALKENLTIQLASILLRSEKYEEIAAQKDVRMLPDSISWKIETAGIRNEASFPAKAADSYVLILLLITLLLERTLANYRNQ